MMKNAKLKPENKKYGNCVLNQWKYHAKLASEGRFTPLPLRYKVGYKKWKKRWVGQPWTAKKAMFWLSEDGTSVTIKN